VFHPCSQELNIQEVSLPHYTCPFAHVQEVSGPTVGNCIMKVVDNQAFSVILIMRFIPVTRH
jgi:hypothetical protein